MRYRFSSLALIMIFYIEELFKCVTDLVQYYNIVKIASIMIMYVQLRPV